MVTCDQQEKVSSSQNVLLWISLEIRYLIWSNADLNGLLVGTGPILIEHWAQTGRPHFLL